ncbi:MAG: L-histidine N(alpha)-methyltransferase [Cyanobacteria bacterium P01_A01_bin.45]
MSLFSTTSSKVEERLKVEYLIEPQTTISNSAGSDVVEAFKKRPKLLPAKYLYDDRGSELFEQICELPEYYSTRTEAEILKKNAHEIARITGAAELVELGSGSSTKTRILIDAYSNLGGKLRYLPVDVSGGILETSARGLLDDFPYLQVHALVGTYESALSNLPPLELPTRMISFLGSTIGNLPDAEFDAFLHLVKNSLQSGEYFLLGADLQKPKHIVEPAYNDSQGVTAAFSLNLLDHLNWRFDGNFDKDKFEFWSFYNEAENQIEMHIRSLKSQSFELRVLDNLKVDFEEGETIRTEISRKFNLDSLKEQLKVRGFTTAQAWTDSKDWFSLILLQRD